ncbi:uncharacterized protein LOC129803990 [Phlebotomus papatasi]|uniref:uncharacterized protein LOC129803990 n=1 Tax=Phlebotomus papatasi TaxID=29031 RepID=UPI0024837AE4|nr:uncharacterized protein LOC129803990 [Phlebotomus papatasi]
MTNERDKNEYSKDELIPPTFLNKHFFEDVLRDTENDKDLEITKFEMIPGTKPGEHFLSIMFKAVISYTSKGKEISSRPFVVKTLPTEDSTKKDMLSTMPVFDRETEMYTKVLPEMKKIMESIGDHDEIAPRLIYHNTDPDILIFEDITKLGYEMNNGFYDFHSTIKVVKKLAKFHALSIYIDDNKYKHKIDLKKYTPMVTEAVVDRLKVFFEGFDYLKDEVRNWLGFEVIADKLAVQNETFVNKLLDVYKHPKAEFKVLCHGDYHVKNMMFIKSGDSIDKIMLLDYQLSFWASPAYDLIYLLYAFGNSETRKRRAEILLNYHDALTEYLNRLGCLRKPLSLLELNIDMLKMGTIELLWAVCYLPYYCMDYEKVGTETLVDPTPEAMANMRRIMYRTDTIVNILKEVLPEFLHKGILD